MSFQRLFSALNRIVYRATKGKVGGRMDKAPVAILTTTGRTTGKRRATPVLFVDDPDGWLVMASNGGRPNHPAWYLNLQANPDVTFEIGADTYAARAETVADDERAAIWPRLTAVYRGYEQYTKKTDRTFPIVRIRRSGSPPA